jgi:hypothetical protein
LSSQERESVREFENVVFFRHPFKGNIGDKFDKCLFWDVHEILTKAEKKDTVPGFET